MQHRRLLIGLLVLVLQACGGAGNSTITPAPPSTGGPITSAVVSPKISEDGINIYFPDNFWVNQATSIAVTASNSTLKSVSWQQTAGPELTFLAGSSQVIGFDVPSAGSYSIELKVVTQTNASINKTITFTAVENTNALVSVRLDHVAIEQAKVSLRVDRSKQATNKTIAAIKWLQTAGPTAIELSSDEHYLFFKAPDVTQDSVLEFSASINFSDGTVGSDSSYVLVKNGNINSAGYFPKFAERIVSPDVFPFIRQSRYASDLVDCVYNNQISASCSFAKLPLLGAEHTNPSIDDVLERLVVSHEWMGRRFKQFLEQSATSGDMLKLLRATTAIVIAYDVRPSFYWSATGAIYLDAANFWVSPQERDTLNDQPDYRSEFGNDLNFIIPWRYVKNNQYYIRNSDYPAADRLTKSFSALEANVSWLMYHELGHANDFFPPSSWPELPSSSSPLAYSNQVEPSSTAFNKLYPLTSEQMKELAQVSFAGNSATSYQKSVQAADVVGLFTPDRAPDYYCYSTVREDYATLFGHFMMAYRLGVSADVAIISSLNNDELTISWGQRNRINSPTIQPRVRAVIANIFPQLNVAQIQNSLPLPQLMKTGMDWFSNIDLSPSPLLFDIQAKPILQKPIDSQDYWQNFPVGPAIPNQ
ncbi:hypothetical protein [Paraglaciecola sp.]|uniref:hypothetical protein n=1 Tax=Paraglaciecola sp. TaxID=1920173 RepID=UPI0030F42D54